MFNFLALEPESFGLDFSDYSLRLIKLRESGAGFNIASFNETEIPEGVIRNGEIKDEKKLVDIIKKTVSSAKGEKLRAKHVIASLPERKAFLRMIQMPCLSEEDLKSSVIFESENYIPLPIDEVYLDFQVISAPIKKKGIEDHYDVLIAALPKKTVDPYFSVLKKSGLTPTALEIESFSIIRALIDNKKIKSPMAIIDLGSIRTAFITFSGLSITDSFTIPISTNDFSSAIVRNLNINPNKAEELKLEYGLNNKSKTGKEIFDALTPVLTDLVEQLKKYFDYYKEHPEDINLSKENVVKKVLLTGGGAMLKGLPEILSEQLSVKVELADPWINILSPGDAVNNKFPKERSLMFSSVFGLALRGLKRMINELKIHFVFHKF